MSLRRHLQPAHFLGANWEPNICKDGQNLLKPSSSTHRDLLHQQWRIVFTQIFLFRPDKLKEFRIKIVGIFVRTSNKQTLSYNVNIGIPSIFSSLPPQKTKYIRPSSLFILNWNIGIEIGLSWAGARLFVSVDRRRLSVECKKSDTFILTMSVFSHSAWRIIIPGHVSGGRNLETDLRSITVSGPWSNKYLINAEPGPPRPAPIKWIICINSNFRSHALNLLLSVARIWSSAEPRALWLIAGEVRGEVP